MKNLLLLSLTAVVFACAPTEKKPDIQGMDVTYSGDNLNMKGYLAYDANQDGKRPGILVVHEWWGHNEYARERARMLAELGYVALAVDMFGDGKLAQHPGDAGQFAGEVFSNLDGARARFEAALETLKKDERVDPEKIGAIGYCFGGSVVLSMANAGYDLDAVVAFHAGVQLPIMPKVNGIKGNILVCNGAADPFIDPASVDAFKNLMDSVKANYQYVAYEGVLHSFTSKYADDMGKKFELPLKYDAYADSASWDAMQRLFAKSFN
jgi:dienelactone hydrolase